MQCGRYVDRLFVNFMLSNGFTQCVTEPTRENNIHDLVFANEPILLSSIRVSTPFSSSGHNSVDFDLCTDNMTQRSSSPTSTYKTYLWSEGDCDSMCAYLRGVKWDDLLTTNFTSDSILSAFCDILNEATELFVPSVIKSRKYKARRTTCPKHIHKIQQWL